MRAHVVLEPHTGARRPWWREPEVALVMVLVLAAYALRMGDLSMRGEEPRRAQVAFELLQRGDWIVPWERGKPFLSRPPLQNWLIAASSVLFGSRAPWVVRLPSVLAMLAIALLIYGYARTRLSRVGALSATFAFTTFGEMFTMGCQAETEMVFIALVGASLLLWHWGQTAGWPARRTWIASYVCVGLAVLCKGPQPPVYFLGSVSVYLLLTGQWRRLCSRAHLAGAAVGVAIVLAWLIPCVLRTSWPTTWQILMGDTTGRLVGWKAREVGVHLLKYPFEVFGCTFPWSLLLLAYPRRDLRQFLGEARPLVHFAAVCLLIAFPTCWIPPEGQTRYFAPLYPCLAVLIGVVVDRCACADVPTGLRDTWSRYAWFMVCVMVLAASWVMLAAAFVAGHARFGPWAEQPLVALGYAAALAGLVLLLIRGRKGGDVSRVRLTVVAVAGFMVLSCTGIVTNVRMRRSEDHANAIARLKEQLPPGQRLVGFGEIDDLFAYYYALPIDCRPMPETANDPAAARVDYFCCGCAEGGLTVLPFAWQPLAFISMDRNRHGRPERTMVVGRVLRSPPYAPSVGAENH